MNGEWMILYWRWCRLHEQPARQTLEITKALSRMEGMRGQGDWHQSLGRIYTKKERRSHDSQIFKSSNRMREACGRVFESQVFVVPNGRAEASRQNFLTTNCPTLAGNWPDWLSKAPYDSVWDRSPSGRYWDSQVVDWVVFLILSCLRDFFIQNSLDTPSWKTLSKVPDSGSGGRVRRAVF